MKLAADMDVIFQMWGSFRQHLIAEHRFYVDQAKHRVLFVLSDADLDQAQSEFADEYLKKSGKCFDPDSDPADYYEAAYHHAIDSTLMLTELRLHTLLSVTAGMYHLWEKRLRAWVQKELNHNFGGEKLSEQIWKVDMSRVIELLGACGWTSLPLAYEKIRQCALIVNVFKHGNGRSLKELKAKYPEFLDDSGLIQTQFPDAWESLSITDNHLDDFADAIEEFWQAVPENLTCADAKNSMVPAPQCFEDAIKADKKTETKAAKAKVLNQSTP